MVNSNKIFTFLFLIIIAAASFLPILCETNYNILDDSRVYDYIGKLDITNKDTLLKLPDQAGRARPGMLFLLLPALGHTSPFIHYLVQTTFFLFLPILIIFWLVNKITNSKIFALLCSLCCLSVPPMVHNYYTLFKPETHILLGTLLFTVLIWQIYFQNNAESISKKILLGVIAVIATVLTYTIKETGIAYFGVYCAGIFIFTAFTKILWKSSLRKSFLLSILNLLAIGVILFIYSRLKNTYSPNAQVDFSFEINDIQKGVLRVFMYFVNTASYIFPALLIWLVSLLFYFKNKNEQLGLKFAWTTYFLVYFTGMITILIPWTELVTRYYLAASVGAVVFSFLCLDLGLYLFKNINHKLFKYLSLLILIITLLMLALNCIFSVMINQCSEGKIRQKIDACYYEMFKYIAENAGYGSTIYFIMEIPETIENTKLSLSVFYNRSDLKCIFPKNIKDFRDDGLVVVSKPSVPYNPDRIPIHYKSSWEFYNKLAPKLMLEQKYSTNVELPIWFTGTKGHRGFQYRTLFGLPDFKKLKNRKYKFSWNIYYYSNTNTFFNLVQNSNFKNGLYEWQYWNNAAKNQKLILPTNGYVRIDNPEGKLTGMKQSLMIPLVSGAVYSLSGFARMPGNTSVNEIFGARLALRTAEGAEKELVWLKQDNNWIKKELIFTNSFNGKGLIFFHMGYGKRKNPGEFTDIKLEKIGEKYCKAPISVFDKNMIVNGKSENLLKNGQFKEKLKNWQLWHSAKTFSNTVKIISVVGKNFRNAVRIENPLKKLVGIQQGVKVKSNAVYRLSGTVRSTATNNNEIIFGGRIGFYLPGQKEKQIVWMSEYNQWWKKELVFTNQFTGMATVYVHMGYGNVASTGEFTDVRLELIK